MRIEIEVTTAGWKQGYGKHTEVFDEQRLSYIRSMAPTPWKCKTNYSNYTVFDAEGKRIATLPNGEKDNQVAGAYTLDLLTAAPDLLAEVKRLRDLVDFAIVVLQSNGETAQADLLKHLRGEEE
jgi:hypothetical protein